MAKTGESRRRGVPPASKPLFIAAVRYGDGGSELFRIEHANDLDDARQVLMAAVMNVRIALIAESTKVRDASR
ncbi:hypothetical protein [Dechloromonas sp. ZS-1]|uniref:hypothetical protein n=1 Tax=Dechloromonas sp. ZS-1 TaxID=3138067 RepID=UPI0031FBF63E